MAVRLSVVIVSFNTEGLLRDCLSSIFASPARAELEVIVVDNASTDGTRKLLKEEFPAVRTILNDDNRRWAGGNNQAASSATGEYLLFLNSDTVVSPGALDAWVEFLDSKPEVSVSGCRLLNPDGSLQRSCRSFPTIVNMFAESFFLYLVFPRSPVLGGFHMTHFDHDTVREVDMVTGAALMVRRRAFERIGPFDESFHFYGEETDFCYRARLLGYRTWFFPGAQITHLVGGSPLHRRRYHENLFDGVRQYLRKHHRGPELWAMLLLQRVGVALRIPVYFLKGIVTVDRSLLSKSVYYGRLLFR